jgi:GTP1/Obg family GTP-binding protein
LQAYKTIYEKLKVKLGSTILQSESLTFTSDCWTSKNAAKSFICFTIHTADEEFKLLSATLGIVSFSGTHTHSVIAEKFRNICKEFDIDITKNKCYIVTDNGSNIKKAFEEMDDIERFHCVLHNIQLIITSAKKSCVEMNNLTSKASSLVQKFNRSALLQEAVYKAQEEVGMHPIKKLIQDVDTRWDSEFQQLSRICELKEALKIVEEKTGQQMFTEHEYKNMKMVI